MKYGTVSSVYQVGVVMPLGRAVPLGSVTGRPAVSNSDGSFWSPFASSTDALLCRSSRLTLIEYRSLFVMLWLKPSLSCRFCVSVSGVRSAELNGTNDESAALPLKKGWNWLNWRWKP